MEVSIVRCYFSGNKFTNAFTHVIGTRGMHIKCCFGVIDKYHLSINLKLQHFKAAKKGPINDYYQKMISSISCSQGKISEVIKFNIQRNYRGIFLSNLNLMSGTYSFITGSSTSSYSNKYISSKGSTFIIDKNPPPNSRRM